ncbi:MAG: cytochrome D ubiquinol oxidase subunit I [Candidatus Eremiobacteraeota bacterium]|nr:cytochrome D ubiquinol oxidase subunit I [Candidatus Eremiobacteraeota bacterium]
MLTESAQILDPADWNAFRALSHAALDDALDYLEGVRDRPVWQEVPAAVRERLSAPMPLEPTPLADVYREFVENVLPYPTGNIHPRFFGWVHGAGTPTGALADFLAATMDSNLGGRNHGAIYVERQVVGWFRDLFAFPPEASGVLTVGTSAANLIAILVARMQALSNVREEGLFGAPRLVGYASAATHGCVRRAFEVAGLGSNALHVLTTDALHRTDPQTVAQAIAEDRERGLQPFLLVGNAGTVDAGAIDPLEELADLAAREKLWFHVDGAFGATAILAPSIAPRLRGIERADSIAFDFHKWLHAPYDAGCVLVRNGELHRSTFASSPSYLTRMPRGLASGTPWFTDFTIDLSRSFRALKVWFIVKEQGANALGEAIEENVRQAKLLGTMIDADPNFDLIAPVQLNVVCFRFVAPGLRDGELDSLNDELVIRLQESGIAVTSSTSIGGRRAIRACILNHRTRDEDLTMLLDALRGIAWAKLGIV